MPKLLNVLAEQPVYTGSDVWHWPMNEGTGTTAAETINSLDVTITDASWGTNDSVNGMQDALGFNGSSTSCLKTSGGIGMGTGSFSTAFWIYNSVTSDSVAYDSRGGAGPTGIQIFIDYHVTNDEGILFRCWDIDGVMIIWTYVGVLPEDTWTHVAWTLNRTTTNTPGILYINGQYSSTLNHDTTGFKTLTPSSSGVVFGYDGSTMYLNGKLCDFWLFRNKVLTASEVLGLYKYLGD